MKKILFSSGMLLVILMSSIYVMLPSTVKFVVEDTRSRIYVYEDDSWVLGATEYVYLYDGTTKMRAKERTVFYKEYDEKVRVTRTSRWKDNIVTTHIYIFNTSSTDVEMIPMESKFICENCQGKIIHFEYRDIDYDGITREAFSPESLGHNMVVEWEDGYDWAKLYQQKIASDKLIVRYRPDDSVNIYEVRMYDPTPDQMNVSLNYPSDSSSIPAWNIVFNYTPSIDAAVTLLNCSLYGNFTGSWAENQSNTSAITSGSVNSFPNLLNLSNYDYEWNAQCCGSSLDETIFSYDFQTTNWTETHTGHGSGRDVVYGASSLYTDLDCSYSWCGQQDSVMTADHDIKAIGVDVNYSIKAVFSGDFSQDDAPGGSDGFWGYIRLGNGTSAADVTLKSFNPGQTTPVTDTSIWLFEFDYANENVTLYDDGVEVGEFDISGVSNSWHPIFEIEKETTVDQGDHEQRVTLSLANSTYFASTTTCEFASANFTFSASTDPDASNVAIIPSVPTPSQDLTCSYGFTNSTGGNGNDNSNVSWFINGFEFVFGEGLPPFYCYQESANETNQSGTDGSCSQIYDGFVNSSNGFGNQSCISSGLFENTFDGNSGTSINVDCGGPGICNTAGGCQVVHIVNYTIPAFTSSAIVQYYVPFVQPRNVTVFSDCLSGNTLDLKYTADGWDERYRVECMNQSSGSYVVMEDYTSSFIFTIFYEEGVFWNISTVTNESILPSENTTEGDIIVCQVEPCDDVLCGSKVNSSSVTVGAEPDVNTATPENISVELGSIVNLRANSSDSMVCIDVSHPDFGVNVSCGASPLDYALNISYFVDITFNDSKTSTNLTYTGSENITLDTVNMHQFAEVINFTMLLSGFEDGGSSPQNVSVYVNDTLSNDVGDLVLTTTTVNQFNDSSTEKNLTFQVSGTETVYVKIQKNINVTSANLTIEGFENGGVCTQNDPAVATGCGDSSDGNAWSTTNYVYLNYKWPEGVNKTATNWTLKHGTDPMQNNSLDAGCSAITGTLLRLRMYSEYDYVDGGLDPAESYGQCSDGSTWTTITDIQNYGVNTITYDDDDDYSELTYDGDFSTYSLWIEDASDGSVDQWSRGVSILNDAILYDSAINWFFDDTYPNNTYMEVGTIDGTREWNFTGTFDGTNTTDDFSTVLNNYLSTCTADDAGFCTVPFYFGSDRRGIMGVKNISIQYQSGSATSSINVDLGLVRNFLGNSSGFVDVPIVFESATQGIIQVSNINLSYRGGNRTYNVTQHNTSYTENFTSELTYYYSDWDYELPVGFFQFSPRNVTSQDVAPYGQDDNAPILNFTAQNYGGVAANLTMKVNETEPASCVNLSFSQTNSSDDKTILVPGSWHVIFGEYTTGQSQSIWMWADYNCNYTSWRLWQPDLDVGACCNTCDICDTP